MGLITKEVEIRVMGNTIKHYENLGYEIPKRMDCFGVLSFIKNNTFLKIKVEDLNYGSNTKVEYECDNCKNLFSIQWRSYINQVKRKKNIFCKKCSLKIFSSDGGKTKRLLNGISLEKYCLEYEKNYGILLWSEKNKKYPKDYTYKSSSKVWWKCENNKHDDYERKIIHALSSDFQCVECTKERTDSFLQNKVSKYFDKLKIKINHEVNCKLLCINPKTKRRLLYDNEIFLKKLKFIIEVHGKQHYLLSDWHKTLARHNNTTPEYELEYIQWKDKIKKEHALKNGYVYLEIPYTADNKENEWKKMIDDILFM